MEATNFYFWDILDGSEYRADGRLYVRPHLFGRTHSISYIILIQIDMTIGFNMCKIESYIFTQQQFNMHAKVRGDLILWRGP